MAYPTYMNYQPNFQQQTMPIMQQPQYAPVVQNNGINWVSGENGAKAWMVGRGETVLLMDSEAQSFYIKSADNSGMPLPLRIFDYTERTQSAPQASNTALIQTNDNFITREEFDVLRAKYDELEKQIKAKNSARKKEVASDE